MKPFILPTLLLLLWLMPARSVAEKNYFEAIDTRAQNIGFLPMDTLVQRLTAPYHTDAEKVRSIFIWITAHIDYDIDGYYHPEEYPPIEQTDSASMVEAANKLYADKTLRTHKGVCSEYAALFQQMCKKAGIKAITIDGYARLYVTDNLAESNHTWNAVQINKHWYLLDVTWASGHTDEGVTTYRRKFDPYYYMTAPEDMIVNHYPEDVKWTLLERPLSLGEFYDRPIFHAERKQFNIISYSPVSNHLFVQRGDTIRFELQVKGEPKPLDIVEYPGPDKYYTPAPKPHSTASAPAGAAKNGKTQKLGDNQIDNILSYTDNLPADTTTVRKPAAAGKVQAIYVAGRTSVKELHVYYGNVCILSYAIHVVKKE